MTMYLIKPPRPRVVLKFMPVKELLIWRLSTYMKEIPPDISLPKARPEPSGVCRWTLLIWIFVEGLPKEIP